MIWKGVIRQDEPPILECAKGHSMLKITSHVKVRHLLMLDHILAYNPIKQSLVPQKLA
jgi:hypothetical protein